MGGKKKLAILAASLAVFFSVPRAGLINGAAQANSPAAPQPSAAPEARSLAGQSHATAPLPSS